MLSDAPCANHPTRSAEIACARCGTFVCAGCVVSGDLCSECKSRLLREGQPWTQEEKARAVARRCLRWAQHTLNAATVITLVAIALHLAVADGMVPGGFGAAAQGLLLLGAGLGLALVTLAGRGYRSSEGGRPGPAVPGVFPAGTALFLGAVGLVAVVAAGALI
jgi:hypothetical protein